VWFPSGGLPGLCRTFTAAERARVGNWRARIDALASRGPVALWGAGAKGVTLADLVDADRSRIACVVDLNPQKQDALCPGPGTRSSA
jgi:hypothetical protein